MKMLVHHLKTNRLANSLGFQLGDRPRLSWIAESDSGKRQTAAQVQVSLTGDFQDIVYDSGKRADIDSLYFPLPMPLAPRTRYFWRVRVWSDDGGEAESSPAWFETAKMDEPWQAGWITPDLPPAVHPVLFSDFELHGPVRSARLYICGLGLYEASFNGRKAGDDCLAPGLSAYDKWLAYQTYDVTDLLAEGANRIEVLLGNGWYKGRYGLNRRIAFQYGDRFALICELKIQYEDGSTETICTEDASWKCRKSIIIESSIFDGESRDDAMKEDAVYGVSLIQPGTDRLEPRRSPPVKVMERLTPIAVINTPAGETVLDMGQNMVGWLEFENRAPAGSEILLQFGEVLQDGNFYRDNLRTAKCEYRYISDGVAKKVRQYFTFYGFRYVKLTKWHGSVNPGDFTGCVLYSDMERTGNIVTDHPLVNRLFLNALWGQKGNYLDVPTDCPQRDERMGWTGDAQVFSGTAAFNMDVFAFFGKYLYDLLQEQRARGGNVPVVVPAHDVLQNGSCAWGDAAVIIPWNMYLYYGDRSILLQQYESMKGWVDYVKSRDEAAGGKRLWVNDFHYGDWLSLDNEDPENRFGGTEMAFLASAYYCHSSGLVAKAAQALGKESDALYYGRLSEEVRRAIQKEYFTPSGRLALTTQTAYTIALHMDLVPEGYRDENAYRLRCRLKENNYHLRTGFVGTPYLCRVLSENGSNDIAYRLLTNTDYPSWLYSVTMGATTIWERWNSILPDGHIGDTGMNSLNHYSYGSIVEWMYKNAAGIRPVENAPGFRHFLLEPQPNCRLGHLRAEFLSPAGKIISQWAILEDGSLRFFFKIPFNTSARLTLPDSLGTAAEGTHELESGEYEFAYRPSRPYKKSYGIDTSLREIYRSPEARALVESRLPVLTSSMLFSMFAGERSVLDFVRQGLAPMEEPEQRELDQRLRSLAYIE
jgi:alpha-L-rhamnosidase